MSQFAKYRAAFVPNILTCVLWGLAFAVLWTPVFAVLFFGAMICGILILIGILERARRRVERQPRSDQAPASQAEIEHWDEFERDRRRETPWIVLYLLFLWGAIWWFAGVNAGTVLLAAGVWVAVLDLLLVKPWMYADIGRRMRDPTVAQH